MHTLEQLRLLLNARGATLSLQRCKGRYHATVDGVDKPYTIAGDSLEMAVDGALRALRVQEVVL